MDNEILEGKLSCIIRSGILKFEAVKSNLSLTFLKNFLTFRTDKNLNNLHYVLKHKIYAVYRVNTRTCLHKLPEACGENKLILKRNQIINKHNAMDYSLLTLYFQSSNSKYSEAWDQKKVNTVRVYNTHRKLLG